MGLGQIGRELERALHRLARVPISLEDGFPPVAPGIRVCSG